VIARPGSALWLLHHEVRLFWYTTLASKKGKEPRGFHWKLLVPWLVIWLAIHAGGWYVVGKVFDGAAEMPQTLVVAASMLLVATFLFMLSSALKSSVEVLFDRGDMDLLLSSPLPSRSIFSVRLAGVVLGVASLYLFFLAPLAHVGLLQGHPRWLALYPVLLGMAAIASAAAMLLTLALVRWLGARRTRVVAQVLGALAGALLFILSQLPNLAVQTGASEGILARMARSSADIAADSLVWLPGRALLGDPMGAATVGVVALLAFALTVALTHRSFTRGLQLTAGIAKPSTRPTGALRFRFHQNLATTLIRKEWRLILRDPQLISQVLLQLLYLIPVLFLVFRKDGAQTLAVGTGLTLLCGSLSSSLAWIVLLSEDAPDLLQSSPANPRTVRHAKLAAAVGPVLALVCVPVLWLTWRAPVSGLLVAFTVCGVAIGSTLIVMWTGKPGERSALARRGQGNGVSAIFELSHLFGWGALAFMLPYAANQAQTGLGMAAGIGFAGAVAGGMPLLAWVFRRRTH